MRTRSFVRETNRINGTANTNSFYRYLLLGEPLDEADLKRGLVSDTVHVSRANRERPRLKTKTPCIRAWPRDVGRPGIGFLGGTERTSGARERKETKCSSKLFYWFQPDLHRRPHLRANHSVVFASARAPARINGRKSRAKGLRRRSFSFAIRRDGPSTSDFTSVESRFFTRPSLRVSMAYPGRNRCRVCMQPLGRERLKL